MAIAAGPKMIMSRDRSIGLWGIEEAGTNALANEMTDWLTYQNVQQIYLCSWGQYTTLLKGDIPVLAGEIASQEQSEIAGSHLE